jgi:hypothetical protein
MVAAAAGVATRPTTAADSSTVAAADRFQRLAVDLVAIMTPFIEVVWIAG